MQKHNDAMTLLRHWGTIAGQAATMLVFLAALAAVLMVLS